MALTTTFQGLSIFGNKIWTRGSANLGVYATGGIAYSAQQFALGVVDQLSPEPQSGYTFVHNPTTKKIQAYRERNDGLGEAAGVEVDNGIDLSGVTFLWTAIGS